MRATTATGEPVHVTLLSARARRRVRRALIGAAAVGVFVTSFSLVQEYRTPAGPTALECQLAPNSTPGCP